MNHKLARKIRLACKSVGRKSRPPVTAEQLLEFLDSLEPTPTAPPEPVPPLEADEPLVEEEEGLDPQQTVMWEGPPEL